MTKYIVPLKGTEIDNKEIEILRRKEVGGVVLYGRNILGYDMTKSFINS